MGLAAKYGSPTDIMHYGGQREAALARLFGRRVDPVSKRSLHSALRPGVLADARLLYAA